MIVMQSHDNMKIRYYINLITITNLPQCPVDDIWCKFQFISKYVICNFWIISLIYVYVLLPFWLCEQVLLYCVYGISRHLNCLNKMTLQNINVGCSYLWPENYVSNDIKEMSSKRFVWHISVRSTIFIICLHIHWKFLDRIRWYWVEYNL